MIDISRMTDEEVLTLLMTECGAPHQHALAELAALRGHPVDDVIDLAEEAQDDD